MLDEPAAGVNPTLTKTLIEKIEELNRDGKTFVIIEHDMDLAFDVADTITVLNYGEVVFDGLPGAARPGGGGIGRRRRAA